MVFAADHLQVHLRLPRRRRLLVHRRHRLGHRPHLHRLRPARRTAPPRVMFEGVPTYPDAGPLLGSRRQAQGQHLLHRADRHPRAHAARATSGRRSTTCPACALLGTVGEPINPEAWMWYHKNIGKERCPIVDTWWQTETGGILITPLPGAIAAQAGLGHAARSSASSRSSLNGRTAAPTRSTRAATSCITAALAGHDARHLRRPSNERFKEVYFDDVPGLLLHRRRLPPDEDGYYWLMGRVDDVINVSGHRLGTAEVESALVSHPQGRRGRRGRLPARDQGRRASTPTSP